VPRRGIRSPGRTGRRRSATSDDVTDRFDGKCLEVDVHDDPAPSLDAGNGGVVRDTGGARRNIKEAKAPGDRRAHGGSGEFFEGW